MDEIILTKELDSKIIQWNIETWEDLKNKFPKGFSVNPTDKEVEEYNDLIHRLSSKWKSMDLYRICKMLFVFEKKRGGRRTSY